MKRTFLTITAAAFILVGCNNSEKAENTENQPTEKAEQEVEESEDIKEVKEEMTTEQLVLGDWAYEYEIEGDNIEVLLTLREDGTYSQSMAGNPVDGTWEFIDEEHIVVKNEHIKSEEGQKWKIEKSTEDELHIDWNVAKGDAKILEFKRQ